MGKVLFCLVVFWKLNVLVFIFKVGVINCFFSKIIEIDILLNGKELIWVINSGFLIMLFCF